jgi:predicted alpha-1,6-mannanase (GH76 family)
MSFMVDYYKTKVDLFNSAWNSGTLTYENYPSTMAAILIDFWPYPRFGTNLQNNKQLDDWFKNNESKAEDLTIKATETLSIMKTNNLL